MVMATCDQTVSTAYRSDSSFEHRIAGVGDIVALVARWAQRSAQRRHLRELDDHLLRDMGLTRADVEREASKPFWAS